MLKIPLFAIFEFYYQTFHDYSFVRVFILCSQIYFSFSFIFEDKSFQIITIPSQEHSLP